MDTDDIASAGPEGSVERRRVFYIPGYDPFPPRRYRELYRTESAKQAAISGYEIEQSPGQRKDAFGWHVSARIDGPVEAEIEVLSWSDIVTASMGHSVAATYGQLLRTAWVYISSGTLRRVMWLRKGPVIAALYPVAMLLGQLFLALALATVVHLAISWPVARVAAASPVIALLASLTGWALGLGAAALLLRWFRRQDGRFFAYYLMHDYAFTAQARGENPPELEARMAAFADRIAKALDDNVDEVLVVGHSSGAHLAVSILADLIRDGRVPRIGPELSLLTLGQVIPMASFLPRAQRLRRDLHDLSASDALSWVDVTTPGDGCAFALCDPVSVTGVEPKGKRWPLILSAAFSQTLQPETWAALRWRFFRLHFQYLCAFDNPGDYDYFRITAGSQTLAERFAHRAPSKQRIDVAASKYTDLAA